MITTRPPRNRDVKPITTRGLPLHVGSVAQITLVAVCCVAIVTTLVSFHDDAVVRASEDGVRSSLALVSTTVGRPFDVLADTTVGIAARVDARATHCDGAYNTKAMASISIDILSALEVYPERIQYLYMLYRLPRLRNGTLVDRTTGWPAGFDANIDYDWGECGCTPKYDPVARPDAYCYFTAPLAETSEPLAVVTRAEFPDSSKNVEEVSRDELTVNEYQYAQEAMSLDRTHAGGTWGSTQIWADPVLNNSLQFAKTLYVPMVFSAEGVATDVMCADLDLGWMRQVLLDLNIPATQIAVIDAVNDHLVATTYWLEQPFNLSEADPDAHTPWPSGRTQNSSLNAAVAVARRCGGAAGAWADMAGAAVCSAGTDLVGVERITLVGNLSLVVVIVVDRSVYFADAERVQLVAVLIGVFGFIVAGAGAFAVIHMITVPLRETGGDMQRAARFALKKEDVEGTKISGIREVAALQMSFVAMALQLIEYRSYLPQSLVCRLEEGDADDNDQRENYCGASVVKSDTQSIGSCLSTSVTPAFVDVPRRPSVPQSGGCVGGEILGGSSNDIKQSTLLSRRHVSVLALNIMDFSHHVTECTSLATLSLIHTAFANAILTATAKYKGITESFSGDRFFCSFNASRPNQYHRECVCRTGLSMVVYAQQEHGIRMSAAATGCNGIVGDAGCERLKKFTIIAGGVTVCHALERFASHWRVPVLVTHRPVYDEIKVAFSTAEGPSVVVRKLCPHEEHMFMVFRELTNMAADEWMYQLDERDKRNPFATWDAFAAAVKREHWEAAEHALAKMGSEAEPPVEENALHEQLRGSFERREYKPHEIVYV